MSIQSKIDFHLSEKGGHQYNILVRGESGSVKLPKGVNLSLYDCTVTNFEANEGDNSVFFGGKETKVTGKFEQSKGNFSCENTKFFGEVFWRKNMRVKLVKDSVFYFRVNAIENVYADIYNCTWDGAGSYALLAQDHCRVTISNSLIVKRTKGPWAQKGSVFDLNNVTIGTAVGIVLDDNSQVNMVDGNLKPTNIGVEATKKCQVYLSNVKPITTPSEFDVKMEDWCKLVVHNTDMQNAKTAIQAKKFSTVEVMDCNVIKSTANDCIILEEHTTGRFIDIRGTIESAGASGISAKNHCTVNAIDVKMIEGKGKDGVTLKDNSTKFEATGKGSGVIKGILAGVRATNKCSVSVDHYQQVIGIGEDGVILDDNCQGVFTLVQNLISEGANGAKLSNESDISFQDHQSINGKGGSGIVADKNCTVNLQTVNSCVGGAGDGIKVTENTEIDVIYTTLIDGKAGFGVNASDNCDVYVKRSNKITGMLGGIKNVTNGLLEVELVTSIAPRGGVGVLVKDEVDTRLNLIEKITWGVVHENCDVRLKDCKKISNESGAGISVKGGEIVIQSVAAEGTTASISMEDTYAKASGTTFGGSMLAQDSEIELNGVTLNGTITSNGDTISINRGEVNGSITGVGSSINIQLADVSISLSLTGGTLDVEKCTIPIINLIGSVIKSRLANGTTLALVASCGDVMGGAIGSITVDSTSSVIIVNVAGAVSGVGNIYIMDGAAGLITTLTAGV